MDIYTADNVFLSYWCLLLQCFCALCVYVKYYVCYVSIKGLSIYAAFERNWNDLVRWKRAGLLEFKRHSSSSRCMDQQQHVWTLHPQPRQNRRLPDPDFCTQPSRRGSIVDSADDRSAIFSLSCGSLLSVGIFFVRMGFEPAIELNELNEWKQNDLANIRAKPVCLRCRPILRLLHKDSIKEVRGTRLRHF